MNIYGDEAVEQRFVERYIASGKRLKMGKACVRFKSLKGLPMDLVGEAIALAPVDRFIEWYEMSWSRWT